MDNETPSGLRAQITELKAFAAELDEEGMSPGQVRETYQLIDKLERKLARMEAQ